MIRLATHDDLPAIVDIFNAAIATRISVAFPHAVTVADRRLWFDAHSPPRYPIFVRVDDTGIAGWLSIEPYSERPAYDATAELSLYVRPDVLYRGIGTALFTHVLAGAPRLNITCFIARMFGTNAASIAFFSRNAFLRWGRLPAIATIDGERRDLLIYGRHLT